jgi:hypothetical protein
MTYSFELYNKNIESRNKLFQYCFYCNTLTGNRVKYKHIKKEYDYIIYVFLCVECCNCFYNKHSLKYLYIIEKIENYIQNLIMP